MKKIALAAALAMTATAASAGNVAPMAADPVPMVMEEKSSGSGALTWIIPLVAIAAIALAADN